MKLRTFSAASGELIVYQRPAAEGPTSCRYQVLPTTEPDRMRDALAAALGVLGRVRKRRYLFLAGQTRIHADEVEGLGPFIELEVVLEKGQRLEEGEAIARRLMERLGIVEADLIAGSYLDLLRARDSP
jgi:predicted adenylyl cyclase CyaB